MIFFLLLRMLSLGEDNPVRVYSDELSNCYVVTDRTITKYDSELNRVARYTSNYGNIYAVDTKQSFKIVLFCRDQYRVILLDNNLTPIQNPLFLPDYNIAQPELTVTASDGGLWIYDSYTRHIHLLDFSSRKLRNSFSIASIAEQGSFCSMSEYQQQLYFALKNVGVFVYSKFGNLVRYLPIPNICQFKIEGDFFYYNDGIKSYKLSELTAIPEDFLHDNLTEFSATKNTIFYFKEKHLYALPFTE